MNIQVNTNGTLPSASFVNLSDTYRLRSGMTSSEVYGRTRNDRILPPESAEAGKVTNMLFRYKNVVLLGRNMKEGKPYH